MQGGGESPVVSEAASRLPDWRAKPVLWLLAAGLVAMFAPVLYKFTSTVWLGDEQGHGPIIIGVCVWLMWQRREALAAAALESRPLPWLGWPLFVASLLVYLVGRIQNIATFEFGAIIPLLGGLFFALFGPKVARAAVFPILFLIFAVPLPGSFVDAITQPLKQAVSYVAEWILHTGGYPVARSGVVLMVGQYQLLVADACAGLNSMFTLEALGILYMNIVGHTNKVRNVLLAVLIIPMAFVANVIRVMVLVLVTYYFGDEAGQGVVHGMAGMVLFAVALTLMFVIDGALGLVFDRKKK